ncbi:hypothetical protein AVEN_178972-1 [Araneus ventricosus]|uniref:Uncharacterized protein n=1 Tax=Araneus ventricosus TaxID=182803 RepID=A0A4Y2N4Z1_ARAVE|nr:hypothetical protein AVEN_178972-1 [Araneus ventricosus]
MQCRYLSKPSWHSTGIFILIITSSKRSFADINKLNVVNHSTSKFFTNIARSSVENLDNPELFWGNTSSATTLPPNFPPNNSEELNQISKISKTSHKETAKLIIK